MHGTPTKIGRALIASAIVAVGIGVAASPASAQESGLTFYSGSFTTAVAHYPAPTGKCETLPATADSHVGWSGFSDIVFYSTADCTGQATGVGTLRSYQPGRWKTFLAS
ncbi:hypothetical protein AB0J90_31680 [Micromonospora sp. NPDC049523]|uniref:hypothetical protein n=1 Tax=Micromonospora sp. NPDC049523 TaxID=3155921 RepID=UPI00342E9672